MLFLLRKKCPHCGLAVSRGRVICPRCYEALSAPETGRRHAFPLMWIVGAVFAGMWISDQVAGTTFLAALPRLWFTIRNAL